MVLLSEEGSEVNFASVRVTLSVMGCPMVHQKRGTGRGKCAGQTGRIIVIALLIVSLISPGCVTILSPTAKVPSVILHFDSKEKLTEFEPVCITDEFTDHSGDIWDVSHYFLLFSEDILYSADVEGVTVLLNRSTRDMVAVYWQYGWLVIGRYTEEGIQGELHVFLECGTHTFFPEPGIAATTADGMPMNLAEEALISALEMGGKDLPPHGGTDGAGVTENVDWADVSYSLSKGTRTIDDWLEEESASGFPRTLRLEPLKSFSNRANYCYFLDPAVRLLDIRSTLNQEGERERYVPGQLIHISEAATTTQGGTDYRFQYTLRTRAAEPGQMVADLATSEAASLVYFLTGLSLSDDTFWVNLHPEEPERIATSSMCSTMIGRIMLEADLQMKKDFCRYENPCESEIGDTYWALLEEKREELVIECMKEYPEIQSVDNVFFGAATRYWIVPGTISAYGDEHEIYIEEAILDIYSDPVSEYSTYDIRFQPTSLSSECEESLDEAAKEYGQYAMEVEKNLVLPLVVDEVNTGHQYVELRQVYLSLALAQWYKPHCDMCLFSKFIDTAQADCLKAWKGRECSEIWREYSNSFGDGGYYCEKTEERGTDEVRKIYRGGGVNFAKIGDYIETIGPVLPPTKQILDEITVERLHRNMCSYLTGLLELTLKDQEQNHTHAWRLILLPVEFQSIRLGGMLEKDVLPFEASPIRVCQLNCGNLTEISFHRTQHEISRFLRVHKVLEGFNA